ncbi:glycosyltransferase family 2 protein [Derxia gummosa]|uniref:Glycosyltransferase family 2 protein n=1 Tax=Derxia gummosa DSM 723 TaxID=1121388 RepID=A0A8B6X5X5_9BURK|nr:glycosyltransferase [Derxia gummosa]
MVRVSVIIKALNEEKGIARAIESALAAVAPLGGEVILADSLSTDRTVEIASRYPIRIVQLESPSDRSCGVGAQLGYQYARGEFVYILDGDMIMKPDFLVRAVAAMADRPEVAGVGGIVVECNTESLEFLARKKRAPKNMSPGEVDRLDMGGLYRRSALERVGYMTNRHLHSYEELELGVRLRARGYKLMRIDCEAVDHFGHSTPAYQLLVRRWRSNYICGLGELVRTSLGQPHMTLILRELRELWLYVAVIGWWVALAVLLATAVAVPDYAIGFGAAFIGLLLAPLAAMTIRKRSVVEASYSVVSWSFNAAGLLKGFFMRPRPAADAIPASVIRD